ncbi:Gti1/Pac2 family-domain-containing protein [Crepidotus variabilis]|uniref:Gti1/Pac2 family-domain-containing protein n=1 Tax=Crepidotus variabilis TaxID=179855 RepID=A0A9P6JJT9_9AGAR|nr:Gti1/Pac2 family-domain-containing protein [Crepidotus variabilis]
MQHPTLQNVRIRSTRDALQVFHGVATHRVPLITRRLDAEERRNIMPGNVYVWEERGANTEPTGLGMERWTDGMGWGPSRVRDEFLFYHQKDSDAADDLLNPVTPWAQMMRRPGSRPNKPFGPDGRPLPDAERLIKQTYSVHVSLPADRPKGIIRKWHLTAYFSPSKLHELDTIDNIRGVGDLAVPDGWFRSARIGRNRRDSRTIGFAPPSPPDLAIQPIPSGSMDYHHPQINAPYHSYPSPSQHMSTPHPYPSSASPHIYTTSSQVTTPTASGYTTPTSSTSSSPRSLLNEYPHNPKNRLVPLEVLVRTAGPRRDPTDEQLLRRFNN